MSKSKMNPKDLVFTDKAGFELKPGDIVVYGRAFGRSAGLVYAKVLHIAESKGFYQTQDENGVESKTTLRVVGVVAPLGSWRNEKVRWVLQAPSSLSFSSRVLRVEGHQVEAAQLEVLNTVDPATFKYDKKKMGGRYGSL